MKYKQILFLFAYVVISSATKHHSTHTLNDAVKVADITNLRVKMLFENVRLQQSQYAWKTAVGKCKKRMLTGYAVRKKPKSTKAIYHGIHSEYRKNLLDITCTARVIFGLPEQHLIMGFTWHDNINGFKEIKRMLTRLRIRNHWNIGDQNQYIVNQTINFELAKSELNKCLAKGDCANISIQHEGIHYKPYFDESIGLLSLRPQLTIPLANRIRVPISSVEDLLQLPFMI